jgi:hypothetical protein
MTKVRERVRERARSPIAVEDTKKKDKVRWIRLAYMLIEYKIMYYYPEVIKEGYHPGLTISDDEYDKLEIEYLTLCKKLNVANTVVHKGYPGLMLGEDVKGDGMFEVDFTRPVVHLIMRKYGISNWQDRIFGKGKK